MGFHHRKLQPKINPSGITLYLKGQKFVVCTQVCDNHCATKCKSYDRPDLPFVFAPPPPPPIYAASEQSNPQLHLSTIFISMFCILGVASAAVCYLIIATRYPANRNNSRRRNQETLDDTHEDFMDDTREDFMDENHGPVVDHVIWLINTVGLEQSVIDSITVFKYKRSEGLIEGTDCSVCLNEFQEGESLRLLPKCSHAFHIPCIDTWLRSHKNCPLCRAPIVSDTNTNVHTTAANPSSSQLGSREEETRVENFETSGELDTRQAVEDGTSGVRARCESFCSLSSEDTREKSQHTNEGICEFRVQSDLADHAAGVEGKLQGMRRAISMDFSAAANIQEVESEGSEGSSGAKLVQVKKPNSDSIAKWENKDLNMHKVLKSSSVSRYMQKGPIFMRRSFSSSGKCFLSTCSKSQNSTLPFVNMNVLPPDSSFRSQ